MREKKTFEILNSHILGAEDTLEGSLDPGSVVDAVCGCLFKALERVVVDLGLHSMDLGCLIKKQKIKSLPNR